MEIPETSMIQTYVLRLRLFCLRFVKTPGLVWVDVRSQPKVTQWVSDEVRIVKRA